VNIRRLSLFSAAFLLACQPSATTERITLIENTTAIDAINGQRANVDILIVDDKITKVGPAIETTEYKGSVQIIDGSNKYVIPGLWDAHVHLSYNKDIGHEVFFPLAIAHGVTSLRDTGGHIDKLSAARTLSKENPSLPDLYISGPLIDGEKRVYDGSSPGFPDLSVGIKTQEEAIEYVDFLASEGVSFVKAYEMLPPDIFAAIAKRADENGLKTAMHIPLSMTAEEAIKAGADDMQHMRNIELSCAQNAEELLQLRREDMAEETDLTPGKLRGEIHADQRARAIPNQSKERCDRLVKSLAENDVYQTPTLTISRFFTRRLFEDPEYKPSFDYMPKSIRDGWYERSSRLKDRAPDAAMLAYDKWILQTLAALSEGGVPIMAGTDAPIAFLTPGASLHEELIMLTEAGLTPKAALRAATYEPARFLGLEASQGTIATGMLADMVILDKNPLNDMKNIKTVDTVIKSGIVIERAELDELLRAPSRASETQD